MVGEGYYSANTAGARVITSALPMVEAALAESPRTDCLRIADFGGCRWRHKPADVGQPAHRHAQQR